MGVNYKNLYNHKFGNLQAIKPLSTGKTPSHELWECCCDCGKTVYIRADNLVTGNTKSCGCLRWHDLTGKRFGKLLVLGISEKVRYKSTRQVQLKYLCQCDCGNVVSVFSSSLVAHETRSCGCLITLGTDDPNFPVHAGLKRKRRRELKHRFDFLWTAPMEDALRKHFGHCAVCGMSDTEHLRLFGTRLHVDHVSPLCKGNGLYPGNVVLLCRTHNLQKGHKLLGDLPEVFASSIVVVADKFRVLWDKELA